MLGQHELLDVGHCGAGNAGQYLADALRRSTTRHHVAHRFGQQQYQQHQQQQRRDATQVQHAAPAEVWNHPCGQKTAKGRAQRKAAEHGVGDHGAALVRAVFTHQRHGIGHGRTQAQAGDKAPHRQVFQAVAVARGQAGQRKHQHRCHQHRLAPKTVGQRPGTQGPTGQTKQCGTEHRPQRRFGNAPFGHQGRGDIANGGGIKTIEQNDAKAQGKNNPLKAREGVLVEHRLHVGRGGGGVVHRKSPDIYCEKRPGKRV